MDRDDVFQIYFPKSCQAPLKKKSTGVFTQGFLNEAFQRMWKAIQHSWLKVTENHQPIFSHILSCQLNDLIIYSYLW